MNAPELLMPAGSLQKLKYAFAYGADAVYLGVPFYSLRARENEFRIAEISEGITLARQQGKKVYITANIFSRNRKINNFLPQLKEWVELKPDAFIMSDPGLMMMAREEFPDIELHLSVQANSMNWQSVKFWKKSLNLHRIILSRELSLNEIKEIHERVPDIELEAFVHGAICIAYSGRCLLSSYMSHRDANQGVCDNSCREKFKVYERPAQTETFVEDMRNPGELYRLDEDSEGTYIFNAKDLCLIEHLQELRDAGVCSFKVEGRTKSVNYVALVARAYRQAIDDMITGKPFNRELLNELEKLANRGYHKGFFDVTTQNEGQNYQNSHSKNHTRIFAGLITGPMREDHKIPIEVRGTFRRSQTLELQGPTMKSVTFQVENIFNSKNIEVDAAHSGSGIHWISGAPESIENGIVSLVTSPEYTQTSEAQRSMHQTQ